MGLFFLTQSLKQSKPEIFQRQVIKIEFKTIRRKKEEKYNLIFLLINMAMHLK